MILMYHNVAECAGFNTVAVSSIEEQLSWVADRTAVVTLAEYTAAIETGGASDNRVAFTVDDAYSSFSTHVLPVCERKNIPVAVFVPVDHVGCWNVWDGSITGERFEIVSWEALAEIARHPLVTVGSHGLSHSRLSLLDESDVRREMAESKQSIENHLGVPVEFFSYPYGQTTDFTKKTVVSARESGYRAACSTRFGRTNRRDDLYRLFRVEIEPVDTMDSFRRKCTSRLHPKLLRRYVKESLHACGLYG